MPVTVEQIAQTLFREHVKMHSYVLAIVRDHHKVEDVLQQLALVAMRKREGIADEGHLLGWMRTTARFLALQLIEKEGRQGQTLAPEVLSELDASWVSIDQHSNADAMEALEHCMGRLSSSAKRLLELRYVEALTGDELASASGQARRTCYRYLAQASRQLSECIDRELTGRRPWPGT